MVSACLNPNHPPFKMVLKKTGSAFIRPRRHYTVPNLSGHVSGSLISEEYWIAQPIVTGVENKAS
jgi:hypothetical protein